MSLGRLATVEVQLIMQHCYLHSMLCFARCSRQTLAAASDAFPWRCLPPVLVRSDSTGPALAERIHSSLLRHCSFALRLDHTAATHNSSADEIDPLLIDMARIPRVLSLDAAANRHSLFQGQLAWLLSQPSLYGLQELQVRTSSLDDRCAQLMVKELPRLQALHLLAMDAARTGPDRSGLLAMLRYLPALTDLRITASPWGTPDGLIHAGQCSRLKRLALGHLPGSLWQRLLMSRGLRHLSSLELSHARTLRPFHGSDRVDWAACFSNLRHLISLRLDTCCGVDGIIAAVRAHCCATLRSLHIRSSQLIDPAEGQSGATSEWMLHGSPVPSEYALRQLAACLHPDCALELQLDPLDQAALPDEEAFAAGASSTDYLDAGEEAWHRVRRMFDAVQSARLQQVAFRSTLMPGTTDVDATAASL